VGTLNVIEEQYAWNGNLARREHTNFIILHHVAGSGLTAQDIHRIHVGNGWVGIGYHFYVRKDGFVFRGRPVNAVGAQCQGYNSQSIGICAEGNYQKETMPEAQKSALVDLLWHVMQLYPGARVARHRDLNATACPGANYPYEEIVVLANKKGEGKEEMVRYQKLRDIPDEYGFRGIVEDLMNAKIIKGDGSDAAGNDDVIDLSHDQVRMLVFLYRGGAFDRRLQAEGLEPVVKILGR
jgi:N-acetylmuramoyl-L-alanine amidase